jgi:Fe-S cluster biogenesis protein NfuA/nitrite reductase/ring-hydroxylating ferredoxin subunit
MSTEVQPTEVQPGEVHPGDLLDRVQKLTTQVDALSDAHARTIAQDLVATVIAMYGDGLQRIIETIEGSREAGATILGQLSQDGAVASLLLIHDLYPVSLEDRVIEALDTVRPYMESHGGNVELKGVTDGVARLELKGSCNGCAASRATLELAIKQALDEHAPDLAGLEVHGVTDAPPAPAAGGVALPMVEVSAPMPGMSAPMPGMSAPMAETSPPMAHMSAPQAPARWVSLADASRPDPGALRALEAEGVRLVLANVGGALLAYEDHCASCGEELGQAALDDGMLRCPACDVEFDLPAAGRAAGGEPLQLTPVPLLETGGLRVAL